MGRILLGVVIGGRLDLAPVGVEDVALCVDELARVRDRRAVHLVGSHAAGTAIRVPRHLPRGW